jgi:hypothetical protein
MLKFLVVVLLSAAPAVVAVAEKPDYSDVPDNIRSWFKSVKSPNKVPCCDIADGHRTTWQSGMADDEFSGYEVPILADVDPDTCEPEDVDCVHPSAKAETVWVRVPKTAVVYNAGNPTGSAVVWYVRQGVRTWHIRCFVPGEGI